MLVGEILDESRQLEALAARTESQVRDVVAPFSVMRAFS
jgi:hypothetical protein